MAKQGPPLKQGEVQSVFDFVLDMAKSEKNRQVVISHDDLAFLMADTGWETEHTLIGRRNDRIRHKMARPLNRKGIDARFTPEGYSFVVHDIIPISITDEEEANIIKSQKKVETCVPYSSTFYPPKKFYNLTKNMEAGVSCRLVGPKGTGKSRMMQEAAARLGLLQTRIAVGKISDPAELIGSKELVQENGVPITKYVLGTLTRCIQEGRVAILEEIDTVAPSIISALNIILEAEADVEIQTEDGPMIIKRHKDFRVCATSNSWGYGEQGAKYAATEEESGATRDRFGWKAFIDYDMAIEKKILSNLLPEAVVKLLYNDDPAHQIGVIYKIREAIKQGNIDEDLSPRSLETFAKYYHINGWHRGWICNIINGFHPDYRDKIAAIVSSQCGNEFTPSENDSEPDEANYIPKMEAEILSGGKKYEGVVNG